MNSTPSSSRIHIGFFGLRNTGKSSLVNRITNQELSVVSDTAGTTTDPVQKAMELLPLGSVLIIDTPGFDDEGELGEKRVKKTKQILARTDIAVLVTDASKDITDSEKEMLRLFEAKEIPYVIAKNKSDIAAQSKDNSNEVSVSALLGTGIDKLKDKLGALATPTQEVRLTSDLVGQGETALLVVPIDKSAPKGRLILPQQQVIRDLLDHGATAIVTRDDTYASTLAALSQKPAIVICDSQVFGEVSKQTPSDIRLTSFSILMARMKGFLHTAIKGAEKIAEIKDDDKVLVCEGCTHHRQCEDIGTVKLPNMIRKFTGANPQFEFTSGHGFPDDLSPYKLIINCGGCMISEKEVSYRMNMAIDEGIPFTNYGTAIAFMKGILKRSTEMFED